MALFVCLFVRAGVCVCAPCTCVCNVSGGMHGWFSCWDAKQQKKGRLSRKVNRVEQGKGEISITETNTFLWTPRLFIFISMEKKTLSAGKLAACLRANLTHPLQTFGGEHRAPE